MFENYLQKNYPDDVPNEIPFVYFIYSILRGCAVACFTSEESCLAAFENFDSCFYDWVAVDYKKLFWYFAECEPDDLILGNDNLDDDDDDHNDDDCSKDDVDFFSYRYPGDLFADKELI